MGSGHCVGGNKHIAGEGDTFGLCAKPKQVLLHSDGEFQYYKVTVDKGTTMTEGKVVTICKGAGLKAVCPGPKGCRSNDEAKCVITPHSSKSTCGEGDGDMWPM